MNRSSRQCGIVLACVLVAACSNSGSGGSSGSSSSSSSGGSSSSSSGGGVLLGNTPVLDYLSPYASADSSGNILLLTLVDPNNGFKSAPQVLATSTQTTLAKLNYLGTFDAQTSLQQHTRPNLYYYASSGALFGVNLHTTIGAAAAQQLGNMSNLSATAVCSINSLSDNLATAHVRIYYSLIGPSNSCTGSDLTSFYVGNDATATTAPTAIPASGEILDITQFHSPSTGITSAAVVREDNGELLYVDGNFQNPQTIQAAGAATPVIIPVIVDSNAFRVVLAGPVPGTSSTGIYTVEADGSVNPLLTNPPGTAYSSAIAAPNHTLYALFSPLPPGGAFSASSSFVYQIDETKATAPAQVYSSNNAIGGFRAYSSGLVTLESVPETAAPTKLDQVVYYEAFPVAGVVFAPKQIDNAGPAAVVGFSGVNGNLLLYNVRQSPVPSGTPGQLASTAKIASVSPVQIVSTQAAGTSWFGTGEIVNRDLSSDSQDGLQYVAQTYNLQQRDGSDPGMDSFFAFPASNLAQGNYTGISLGSVDYGSSVVGVNARGVTNREDVGLGELAVTYSKGSAAVNDVYGFDDFDDLGAQITNTPSVNEITY